MKSTTTIIVALMLLPEISQAKAMTFFLYSDCKISHVEKKSEYSEIVNEVEVKASSRTVAIRQEDCSQTAYAFYQKAARKIADDEFSLQGEAKPPYISPVRCGTIPGREGTDFILIESSIGGMPEDIVNKSIFQVFTIKRPWKNAGPIPVFGAFLDKKDVDNSANLKAVCTNDHLIIDKCGKLGCDYRVLSLNHSEGSIEIKEIEGGWGD